MVTTVIRVLQIAQTRCCVTSAVRSMPGRRMARGETPGERDRVSRPPDDEELTCSLPLPVNASTPCTTVVRIHAAAVPLLRPQQLRLQALAEEFLGEEGVPLCIVVRDRMPIERPSPCTCRGATGCAPPRGRPGELGSPLRQKVSRYCAMLLPSYRRWPRMHAPHCTWDGWAPR